MNDSTSSQKEKKTKRERERERKEKTRPQAVRLISVDSKQISVGCRTETLFLDPRLQHLPLRPHN